MAIFSIADLHLSFSVNKPMDKFGSRWQGYVAKLEKNWRAVVSEDDTVIIPGDISWAMTLDEALEDFKFIDSLPGKKLIGKGNHDFWWTTVTKAERFLSDNGITSIRFLHNNAYRVEDYIVCGTRGWFLDEHMQKTVGNVDHAKIAAREAIRLELAVDCAEKIRKSENIPEAEILVYLHFPPVYRDFVWRELIDVLHKHNIKSVYYGHIHGVYTIPAKISFEGIDIRIISADYLNFIPLLKGYTI